MTQTGLPTRVELVEKTSGYDGYFQVDKYVVRHERFDGGMTEPIHREVFERGHAAAAVLYDPRVDRLVMIEQFRIGAFAAGWTSWMTEVVAGIIEPGETPEQVIRREAKEEANCTVTDLERLSIFQVSPGASTESIVMFCGQVNAEDAHGIHGLDHEHEDIRVSAVPVDEVFRDLDSGRIVNATAIIGLWQFRHRHHELRQRWLAGG